MLFDCELYESVVKCLYSFTFSNDSQARVYNIYKA